MGIQQTKSLLKTYYSKTSPKDQDDYLQKGFCPEALQIGEFLENFWDTHASEYFDWTNVQENKKHEEIAREKEKFYTREKFLVQDLPLNSTTTESMFSIEPIAEYKEAFNPTDTKYFSNSFIKRMHIILIAYVRKILSTYNENSTLECIAKYFDSIQEDNTQKFGLEMGMNLFVKMLDDISGKNLRLKEETLDFLMNNSQFVRPLAFWGETKQHFLLDKSLNEIVNYLKKIISNKEEESTYRYKAFKILLTFGLAKGSLKNLLDFTDFYQYVDDYIDLNYEFNLFKNEFIKLSLSYPIQANVKVKSKLWGFRLTENKKEIEEDIKNEQVSVTNDGNYLYLFSSIGYIAKIGSGYNNTMLGKVYRIKENYRKGEKGTIACVENVLYYRSSHIDPNPVICLDPDTLEEIPVCYELDTKEPNQLWVEGKKNDFEFPHDSYKDMTEIIEKKKNFGAEDKANVRPGTNSPMVTEGRYIYIFSKWYDDVDVNFDKQVDDDDDEPNKNTNKNTTCSIYGVDIYDPLDNMSHVKSVKFTLNKQGLTEETQFDFLKPNTIYYTNGNIFVVDKLKFNLATGEESEKALDYTDNLKTCSYDLANNVIWGMAFKPEKIADRIETFCYFNHSAKPIVEYPETSSKYMPCSLEKIIQHTEDLIKVKNFSNQISMKTFRRENTLNILGLEDFSSIEFKSQRLIEADVKNTLELEIYKKSTQCLILSTIAKLSEYYGQVPDMKSANTDEERGNILAKATRRPYCVKLEPETFEILIKFIEEFSSKFFSKNVSYDNDLKRLHNYCLLSTIKILRTNLKCLSISNLELDFFIKNKTNNPFLKMKEFIFRIFEVYHQQRQDSVNKEDLDIIKALYEECKIILQVSVNTLYPDYYEIIDILEREIRNFRDSKYSRDIVKCILEWMSNEENMKNLLLKLKKDEISRIFNIFDIVSSWEVEHFAQFIKDIKSLKQLPKYTHTSDDELIAFKFSSNMQIEILKSLSKKLMNDNYDEIENEQILHQFSSIIFGKVVRVFRSLKQFLEQVPNILEEDWESTHKENKGEEEVIDTCFKPAVKVEDTKEETLEEYKKLKYKEIWNFLIDKVLNNELLILRTFNFHIECLSILSSNFIISSLMLNSYNQIIEEMNQIFSLLKECEKSEEQQEFNDYKELIFESDHPYLASQTKWFTLEIPGEKEIFIEFDAQTSCKQNCSYVQMYTDTSMATYAFPQYTNLTTNFPKETLHYTNPPLHLYFYSDACANSQNFFGFKVKIHNGKNNSIVKLDDKFTSMMRSVCWVSCKCSAQLLRGNFTKAVNSGAEEDDQKYNNLLNSKLFAGGIDFEDIKKDNDTLLQNVINIFESIIPEGEDAFYYSPKRSTERILLNNILNGDEENINKVLKLFQKKFSKEVVWAYLGGDQADRLVRAAFAALLRHSGQSAEFDEVVDFIEFGEDKETEDKTLDGDALGVANEIEGNIFNHPSTPSLYKKWLVASRMRTWLVEKKKNVDEALEKTKTTKQTPKKEEENKESAIIPQDKDSSAENNSEEIMKKIIEQTIIKAKFLIKLNPSPAFFCGKDEPHHKSSGVSLVRSSSIEDAQSEDDWKRRLNQWKAVQKSKKVLKSVEEEANEKLTSLSSSILMCLQSAISSKRLFNKIKVATIRAKGREIGLMTIKNIFEKISHSALVQDLLSWFCASLRKTETKICHYLDGVSGCGKYFEDRVQNAFQEFIILLINKLIKTEKVSELKSFIDALMWKYSSNDHKFLVDQSVFLILWGTYNEAIKNTWGKPLKATFEVPEEQKLKTENMEFTNNLLEIFEILANICLDKATQPSERHLRMQDKLAKAQSQVNIKFPTLEKHVSVVDDNNSESLVRHILDVIFGEVGKSIQSYLRHRGISYNLWKQYEQYEEDKTEDKKKKKETAVAATVANEFLNNSGEEDQVGLNREAEERLEVESLSQGENAAINNEEEEKREKEKEKENTENAETPYHYFAADLVSLYDEYRVIDLRSSKANKKTFIAANNLLSIVFTQNAPIYDPEFLNRLLTILYKCSTQHSDQILFSIANPLNFSSLLKLMRLCSTQNKILISKILQNVCVTMPEEILIESVDMYIQSPEGDVFIENFAEKRKDFVAYDKRVFVELIIEIIKDIRNKAWSKSNESSGAYIVSSELILLLRRLLYTEQWNEIVNELFTSLFTKNEIANDYLRKEIILAVFGGDYFGQANGAKVRVKSESGKGINFDFIKKDFTEHYNYGTIVGFSTSIDEVWNKKAGTKDSKKKKVKHASVNLTPNNAIESQVAVLLYESILKEEFNLMDLTPKIFHQHEIMITQNNLQFEHVKFNKESLVPLFSYILYDKNKTSEGLNLKVNIIRFLENLMKNDKGIETLLELEDEYLSDVIYELVVIANKSIQHKSNYLNLDLLEEKRFRVLNYCADNNYSLSEIPKMSLSIRKPNYLLIRLSSENLLNLSFPILGANNYENLLKISDFFDFTVDKFEDKVNTNRDIIFASPDNVDKYLDNRRRLIITHSLDLKHYEGKTKKNEFTSLVTVDTSTFEEIVSLFESIYVKDKKLEETDTYKRVFPESEESSTANNMFRELEEFGFSRELINREISKSKESLDLNSLINNLIDYKEKRKELEDKTEEEKQEFDKMEQEKEDKEEKENEEEIEIEPKNECFNTAEAEAKVVIPEYFEEMLVQDNEDHSLLYKQLKSLNEKILVLYSRRIVLTLLNKLFNETESNHSKYEALLTKVPVEIIVNVLKLLTHEGLFLNSINWGSDLLLQIRNVLTKVYTSSLSNKVTQISQSLADSTLKDLESVLRGKRMSYEFVTRNEDSIIQRPMIFFSIWNLMIMNEYSKNKTQYPLIFNILAGLLTKVNDNRQIRWFILDLLIQFVYKISFKIKEEPEFAAQLALEKPFKDLEHVNKLRIFLDQSINKESKKNLSKRSQMICELLIYIDELDSRIASLTGKQEDSNINYLIETDIKKDNFVKDLLTTFEMMKDFFDKKYIKYLAWTEMNPEIINSSKLNFESSHLYPKAPHTFLINVPNTSGLEVNFNSDTLLDNGDAVVFSLDKNCHYPVECYANRCSKKTFNVQSSHMFVHFPSNYLTEVYSFGSNTYSRLGQTGVDVFTPKLIESLSSSIIKDVAIGDTFLMVLTESGDLLSCGNGVAAGLKQTTNQFTRATSILQPDKIQSEGISVIGVKDGSTIVATKDYSFYSIGINSFGQLGQNWTSPVNDITSMNFTKRIKQIAVAETHTMFVSFEGQVYHIGNNDYYQSGESSATRNNTPKLLGLNKTLSCELVSVGEYFTIFLMKDIVTGKRKLYASGWSKQGRTGTGKDEEYHGFKAISHPDLENVEFKHVASGKLCSVAISTTGKLYSWGNNSRGQLGLGHFNDVLEPTLVTFFDKYEVEDASISSEHTLVIAKDNAKISVFGFGDSSNGKLGETITQKSEKKDSVPTPIKISYFEGKSPSKVCAGPRASLVICKLQPYETLRDIHNVTCTLCAKNQIVGSLFTEIDQDILKVYCSDCIKIVDMSDKNPRLLFKSPLKDYNLLTQICKKFINTLDNDNIEDSSSPANCKQCKESINISSSGAYMYLDNKAKFFLCNNCIDKFPNQVTSAKVYIRVFKVLKNIEISNINNFYENSISYGHKFTVTPISNEKGCETVIEKHANSFANFIDDINDYNKFEVYEQLVDLLNCIAQKAERSIFTYVPKELSFKKEELSVRNVLEKCSPELLRKMFVILKILNNKVKEFLPFVDFSKVLQDNQRLSYHFNKITPLIFWDTKNELIKYYLDKTSTEHEVSEVKINRMKVRRFIEKGKPDHTGEYTIFGIIFQFLKQKTFKIFRKKEGGNSNKMFNVTFVGEASIDAGGPYREAMTQACTELQSTALPLFIPSPNQKNESGLLREKWVINPSAKSTTHLEMYKYLGGLLGYAMRTGEFLNMDLPSFFWKQLLEAPVDRKDLELIDRYTIQCLDDIININKKGVTPESFSFFVDQKFTTCLSDGSEVEVIEAGKEIEVTYHDRVRYCELVEKVRLEESKVQMTAIRSGLEQVIPLGLLKLLSWKELETLVCGKPILDVDLLKENTIYRGCSDSDTVIQNLWKCLEEFSAEERSMYLRFVWGRSRLPLTSKDFPMKHRIEILHHNNPDIALPTSHTCFFSLEIPKYTTYEILKEKLKYAITHCQAIDTDGRPYEIWQDED